MAQASQDPKSLSEVQSSIYPGHRVLAMFPFYNEHKKLTRLVPKLRDGLVDKWLPVDDGSTDDGATILTDAGIEFLRQPSRKGIGACIKRCVRYAQENGYDILVVMAGNDKDNPAEIPRLLKPIVDGEVDYVQGSRFLEGGNSPHLPTFRRVAITFLSLAFRLYTRKTCTDLTNGFRAYRVGILDDPRIDIWQDWLNDYEYEYYVQWKVHTLGLRASEVPVTKTYPDDPNEEYSKIKPVTGWWRMLRPFFFLALGIKK